MMISMFQQKLKCAVFPRHIVFSTSLHAAPGLNNFTHAMENVFATDEPTQISKTDTFPKTLNSWYSHPMFDGSCLSRSLTPLYYLLELVMTTYLFFLSNLSWTPGCRLRKRRRLKNRNKVVTNIIWKMIE